MWHELVHCSKERVALSVRSVIAVGARRTDVRADELLVLCIFFSCYYPPADGER